MNVREWALVAFSILAQMSVGSFLVLSVVRYFAVRGAGEAEADRLSDRALLAIIPALGLGFVASLLHLGNPLAAYRAVANVGTSWLSREILLGVLFAVLGGVFTLMQLRKVASPTLRNLVAWAAALCGVAMVYSMSSVYMLETQPAWNTIATPISFFVTTMLLGSLAMGAAFVANYAYVHGKEPACAESQCVLLRGALRWIAVAVIVLLGAEFLVAPLYTAYLGAQGGAAAESLGLMVGPFGAIFALRLILVFLGAGILAVFVYQSAQRAGHERLTANLTYAAFLCVFVAEVLERYLFYATHIRIGI